MKANPLHLVFARHLFVADPPFFSVVDRGERPGVKSQGFQVKVRRPNAPLSFLPQSAALGAERAGS